MITFISLWVQSGDDVAITVLNIESSTGVLASADAELHCAVNRNNDGCIAVTVIVTIVRTAEGYTCRQRRSIPRDRTSVMWAM